MRRSPQQDDKFREVPVNRSQTEPLNSEIFDMLFDGVLVIENDTIVQVNQGLLAMTGYKARDFLGHSPAEFREWHDFARELAGMSEGTLSFESLLPRKKSMATHVTVRAKKLLQRKASVIIVVFAGITENEPASVSLLRSAERYRSLFQSIPDLIFTKDQKLRYSEVNPAMEKTLGLPASKIIGRTAEHLYGKDAGERIRAWDFRALSGETIEEEHTVPIKGENLVFHEVRFPIRNSSDEIIGVCGLSRNITERRLLERKAETSPSNYSSQAMKKTMHSAKQAAATDSIILLLGESGAGKDHLARWLHDNSARSGSPFFTINCAAVPHELAESELFGYEAGAFTGAGNRKKGLLELAEGGTLLLNEVAELSLPLQSKLLVFLDSRSFYRIGGQKSVRVDARIIAATHRPLELEVAEGRFLKPLYYRLNVLQIEVPPLRERKEDIPQLCRELISKIAAEMNLPNVPALHSQALKNLMQYNWPGNIRELRNVIEKGLISWRSGKLNLSIPLNELEPECGPVNISVDPGKSLKELSREFERLVCLEAIRRNGGNRSVAARSLGVSRDSLYRHIRQ